VYISPSTLWAPLATAPTRPPNVNGNISSQVFVKVYESIQCFVVLQIVPF
jgi:hypothetical protein